MGNNEIIVVCSQCGRNVYCGREADVIVCCPSCGALLYKLGDGNQ